MCVTKFTLMFESSYKGPHRVCASQVLFNRRKLIVEISLDFSGVENLGQVFERMVVKMNAFGIFTQIKL